MYLDHRTNTFDDSLLAIRTGEEQIYIDARRGDTLIYGLNWISACEYELTLKHSTSENKGLIEIGDRLKVVQEPVDALRFTYHSTIMKDGMESEFKGTMKKVE